MVKNPRIQIIRAIAIIAVVLIHTCPKNEVQIYVRPFINYGVATFLFLSGYLTDTSCIRNNTWHFYKKRILRVLIPYIIWSVTYTTVSFAPDWKEFNLGKYLINFLSTGGAVTLYYIFVYIQFVLLTPFLGKLLDKKYWWLGLLISPLALILNYYWLFCGVEPNRVVSTLWKICCLGWFSFYYLGLYFRNKLKRKRFNIVRLSFIYVFTIVFQMIEGYVWYNMGSTNCGTQLKMSSLLTNTVFVMMVYYYIVNRRIRGDNKFLILIGDYSFGIYMVHILVMKLLAAIPMWSSVPYVVNSVVVLLVSLGCVILGDRIFGGKVSGYLGLR